MEAGSQWNALFSGNACSCMPQREGHHHMHHIHPIQSRFQNGTDWFGQTDAVFCHIVVENPQISSGDHVMPRLPYPVGIGLTTHT